MTMTYTDYLARLQAPVPQLGSRRSSRRSEKGIERRAVAAAAIVAARVCTCPAEHPSIQAFREYEARSILAAMRQDEARVRQERAAELRRAADWARDEDRRAAAGLRGFKRALELAARWERQERSRERRRRHREYLARRVKRAMELAEVGQRSLVCSAQPIGDRLDQPGPLVRVGPATQPAGPATGQTIRQQPAGPEPSQTSRELSRRTSLSRTGLSQAEQPLTHDLAAKLVAALALQPSSLEPEPEQMDQPGIRYDVSDYTNPDRGMWSGSAKEAQHMDRDDLSLYDEAQLSQILAVEEGTGSVNRPTHATMLSRACFSRAGLEEPADWAAGEIKANVEAAEGAARNSASPERLREMVIDFGSAELPPSRNGGTILF